MIGPFAEVLATTNHEADIVYAELDYAQASAEEGRSKKHPLLLHSKVVLKLIQRTDGSE